MDIDVEGSEASVLPQPLLLDFNSQPSLKSTAHYQNKTQVMGIENTWGDDTIFNSPPSSDYAIPLPPPSGYGDYTSCVEVASDPDPFTTELDALFSSGDHINDVSDSNGEAGVCGLRNLGNTCFMSTGVQCLMATPSLVRCLLDKSQSQLSEDGSLTARLAALTDKMWSGHYSSVQPGDFKQSLGALYPQFKDFRQHDCQEFLALLLDGLHEQLNSAGSKTSSNPEPVDDVIMDKLFQVDEGIACEEIDNCCSSGEDMDSNDIPQTNTNNMLISFADSGDKTFVEKLNGENESASVEKNNLGLNEDQSKVKQSSECSVNINLPVKSKNVSSSSFVNSRIVGNNLKSNETGIKSDNNSALNNYSHCLSNIKDIMKDAKTSNVNVLVTDEEVNNEIKFDSDKYPKSENTRRKESSNVNVFQIYENNTTNGKRVNSTVTQYSSVADFREGLDLKRIKMHRFEADAADADAEHEKNHKMEHERKNRVLDINLVEKNLRIECERKQRKLDDINMEAETAGASSSLVEPIVLDGVSSSKLSDGEKPEEEADNHWEKHLASNQSIIVDTFQGQFKSTVVCSACKYVSVTYEPFMYLSVPLPHAMERQICVTFVPASKSVPVQYVVTLNKRDKVSTLKEQMLRLLEDSDVRGPIILAEVLENHIAKFLNDNHLIRFVDDVVRSIYAFELEVNVDSDIEPSEETKNLSSDKVWDGGEDEQMSANPKCTICFEEKEANMKRHLGCDCVLCDACVTTSCEHYGKDGMVCPVCRLKLDPDIELVAVEKSLPSWPTVRMLHVPVVYRLDTLGDGNNNKKTVSLFGHPGLLRLPNNISCQSLYSVIASINPYEGDFKILLVDGQGRHCSRCMFNSHCRGCVVEGEGEGEDGGPVHLRTGDTLAVTFTEPVSELHVSKHESVAALRSQQPLRIYDCIQAFSQSEVLDKQNPWFCPKCQKNQCATKTLSIWRYPDYLIVYLKRFVFHDGVSTKLEDKVIFPIHGLNLSPYTSLYDLYACVCHIGGVSAGHYTSYTQHPQTGEWHYYNDDYVTKQMPQEEDYSNAYILFYKKRGLSVGTWPTVSDGVAAACSSNSQ
ncbi:ubiquitin carboxyl-terminal hydrolase 10 [Nilaparvata lugens]|uniref:ubiquitin carboxyl-terminal hydrolase 10 n=1 Tax=Nilaparvata lugens TaxID=108931 RepID=UPI000B98A9CB|nr:ubiquitin carboxyl-terminal hydrolase 10 [Nilaparvata lugens]